MTYHSYYPLSIIILNITRSMHSRACSSLFPIRTTVLYFNSFQSHCDVQSASNPRIFSASRARMFSAHGGSRVILLWSMDYGVILLVEASLLLSDVSVKVGVWCSCSSLVVSPIEKIGRSIGWAINKTNQDIRT